MLKMREKTSEAYDVGKGKLSKNFFNHFNHHFFIFEEFWRFFPIAEVLLIYWEKSTELIFLYCYVLISTCFSAFQIIDKFKINNISQIKTWNLISFFLFFDLGIAYTTTSLLNSFIKSKISRIESTELNLQLKLYIQLIFFLKVVVLKSHKIWAQHWGGKYNSISVDHIGTSRPEPLE